MDFIDVVKNHAAQVISRKDNIATEEGTKTSLIMPFFQQVLGYDVFNLDEFCPEFTADVGIKKGEKVDYAIMQDGNPTILIEAKWCGDTLNKHGSQLFRYFGTTTAKFGILTNGVVYNFYTDLDEPNKMDLKPFLELDLTNLKDTVVSELKKFHKSNFNVEEIFSTASWLKYSNEIKRLFSEELQSPSEDFTKYVMSKVYDGVRTQSAVEKFVPILKTSLNSYINELMNDKIKAALNGSKDSMNDSEIEQEQDNSGIITTDNEIEAYYAIKYMLAETVPAEKVTYKDTKAYFSINYDNNTWKWICRIKLDGSKKYILLPDEDKNPIRFDIDNISDVLHYKDNLIEVVKRYA
ncbi:MAG: type I restriction endonuclease [Bacillota bacterium]|jgi:hypothetical protein